MRESVVVDTKIIRKAMRSREMTETAFSVFVGLSQSTISRIFVKRGICWLETALKLSEALKMPITDILAEPLTPNIEAELEIPTGDNKYNPARKKLEKLLAVQKRCGLCRFIEANENARKKDYTVIQGNEIEIKKCAISDWLVTDVNRGCSEFEGVRV